MRKIAKFVNAQDEQKIEKMIKSKKTSINVVKKMLNMFRDAIEVVEDDPDYGKRMSDIISLTKSFAGSSSGYYLYSEENWDAEKLYNFPQLKKSYSKESETTKFSFKSGNIGNYKVCVIKLENIDIYGGYEEYHAIII